MRVTLCAALTLVASSCACGPEPEDPDVCPTTGTGTITVQHQGLPGSLTGAVRLLGPNETRLSGDTSTSAPAGSWTLESERVVAADPRVRTVYRASFSPERFCLEDGQTQTVTATWAKVPTSNTVWATNMNAPGRLLGFRSAQVASTSTQAPAVAVRSGFGADVAFDKDGNLWAPGATTTDPQLGLYLSRDLAASGSPTPTRALTAQGLDCMPPVFALAFSPKGELYVSSACANRVVALTVQQVAAGGDATPRLALPVTDARGMAFDAQGNLWVASGSGRTLTRWDHSQLESGAVASPARTLAVRASSDEGNDTHYQTSWLAFDAAGDLWGSDLSIGDFFRVRADDLRGTGEATVQPAVRVTVGVLHIINGFAFDEGGGLWASSVAGSIFRLPPSQLAASDSVTPELVITSSDIGSARNLTLYPAPAALPLYHALP